MIGQAAAINKCKTPEGRTVYQDAPCPGAESVNLSGAGKADLSSPGALYMQREIARQDRNSKVRDAIARGAVSIGMTADEVVQSWGRPTKVNRSIGAGGAHEQWVYDRGDFRAQYVYLDNGVVTGAQSQE
ncbi:DUF4124 domain-containing protein [Ideonella sp. B508-1]|uniref:DUF4124 domain-containing protein n=1 Tax=Ideonella sp. B508-1 TaxID=137716 RepID=UPI00131F20F7|nr:DUF4124 domain-containing protein [Ideonella sp. B508-1]